jgi:hypothetical protein
MFIGEGPGFDEGMQGRPFVGKAGALLDKMITAMQFTREEVYIANTCSQIGPRNTRLLGAELVIDRKMVEGGFDCHDTIGWMGSDGPHYKGVPVAYRALLPKGVDNLLAAGRCLGAPDSCDIFRLIAPCFVTGEAAGTAAALAALKGVTPRQLDVGSVQKALREKNVWLG